MAPPKAKGQKMGLGEFLTDTSLGSWADEMEDAPMPSGRPGFSQDRPHGFSGVGSGPTSERPYFTRDSLPLPTKPPYTVHIGNMSFDALEGDVLDLFSACEVTSVRIVEDRVDRKPKGFAYAEFASLTGLKNALEYNGYSFQGRNIRVSVAEPQKDRAEARELNDWTRRGPLPDLGPSRKPGFEKSGFSGRNVEPGMDGGSDRPNRRLGLEQNDGKFRDFSNWERKGPLPSAAPTSASSARSSERPQSRDGPRDRRSSPAWGEGRSQDGSRPPRREFADRPMPERAPTAADLDTQWRLKMRPDPSPAATSTSPGPSAADGPPNESPKSEGNPTALQKPTIRPKLNLQKRTVSQAESSVSQTATADPKVSPFGAARPIDTAAREKEIEDKIRTRKEHEERTREQKRQADEKTKEEKRAAKDGEKADKSKIKPSESAKDPDAGTGASRNFQILRREAVEEAVDGLERPEDLKVANGTHEKNEAPVPKSTEVELGHSSTASAEEEGWSTVSKTSKNRRAGNNIGRTAGS